MPKRRTGNGKTTTRGKKGVEGANRAFSEEDWVAYFDAVDEIKDDQKKSNAGYSGKIAAQFQEMKKQSGFPSALIKQKYRKHAFERAEMAMIDGMTPEDKDKWLALGEQLGEDTPLGKFAADQAKAGEAAH